MTPYLSIPHIALPFPLSSLIPIINNQKDLTSGLLKEVNWQEGIFLVKSLVANPTMMTMMAMENVYVRTKEYKT